MTIALASQHGIKKEWWKSAVVYQIYPASFCDSNNDGVGDLVGIISKVDYLHSLGVDVLWLSPIFKSPQADMGYDVSDYEDIHAPYGTVADVDRLITELHQRGMKLVLDLVANHTSDEHPWFIDSRKSKDAKKRDWYHWRPARYDADGTRRPPNNWRAAFGGSVWEWDEATQEYFLHYYDPKQPDLNYDNVEVREAIYSMMRFWLDRGCDGYRMDVIGRISKNMDFPDVPVTNPASEWQDFRTGAEFFTPRTHEYIHEMNRKVISQYDMFTVGEFNDTDQAAMVKYTHPDRQELQMGISFEHVNMGLSKTNRLIIEGWELPEFKNILSRWQTMRDRGAWHALYLENHDQPRSVSRFASDGPEWRVASAKMLCLMHCTLFGTLYVYQGQEIGMINLPSDWPLEEWVDVRTQNFARELIAKGTNPQQAVKTLCAKARDNARSPMQWSAGINGGFSDAKPWMRASEDSAICNVKSQEGKPDSILTFWKEMLQLRKKLDDALIYGSYELLSPEDKTIFAYVRAGKYLVALNFSDKPVSYEVPLSVVGAKLVKATWSGAKPALEVDTVDLEPYSGVLYALGASL